MQAVRSPQVVKSTTQPDGGLPLLAVTLHELLGQVAEHACHTPLVGCTATDDTGTERYAVLCTDHVALVAMACGSEQEAETTWVKVIHLGATPLACAWAPNGSAIAVGDAAGRLHIVLANGQLLFSKQVMDPSKHAGPVWAGLAWPTPPPLIDCEDVLVLCSAYGAAHVLQGFEVEQLEAAAAEQDASLLATVKAGLRMTRLDLTLCHADVCSISAWQDGQHVHILAAGSGAASVSAWQVPMQLSESAGSVRAAQEPLYTWSSKDLGWPEASAASVHCAPACSHAVVRSSLGQWCAVPVAGPSAGPVIAGPDVHTLRQCMLAPGALIGLPAGSFAVISLAGEHGLLVHALTAQGARPCAVLELPAAHRCMGAAVLGGRSRRVLALTQASHGAAQPTIWSATAGSVALQLEQLASKSGIDAMAAWAGANAVPAHVTALATVTACLGSIHACTMHVLDAVLDDSDAAADATEEAYMLAACRRYSQHAAEAGAVPVEAAQWQSLDGAVDWQRRLLAQAKQAWPALRASDCAQALAQLVQVGAMSASAQDELLSLGCSRHEPGSPRPAPLAAALHKWAAFQRMWFAARGFDADVDSVDAVAEWQDFRDCSVEQLLQRAMNAQPALQAALMPLLCLDTAQALALSQVLPAPEQCTPQQLAWAMQRLQPFAYSMPAQQRANLAAWTQLSVVALLSHEAGQAISWPDAAQHLGVALELGTAACDPEGSPLTTSLSAAAELTFQRVGVSLLPDAPSWAARLAGVAAVGASLQRTLGMEWQWHELAACSPGSLLLELLTTAPNARMVTLVFSHTLPALASALRSTPAALLLECVYSAANTGACVDQPRLGDWLMQGSAQLPDAADRSKLLSDVLTYLPILLHEHMLPQLAQACTQHEHPELREAIATAIVRTAHAQYREAAGVPSREQALAGEVSVSSTDALVLAADVCWVQHHDAALAVLLAANVHLDALCQVAALVASAVVHRVPCLPPSVQHQAAREATTSDTAALFCDLVGKPALQQWVWHAQHVLAGCLAWPAALQGAPAAGPLTRLALIIRPEYQRMPVLYLASAMRGAVRAAMHAAGSQRAALTASVLTQADQQAAALPGREHGAHELQAVAATAMLAQCRQAAGGRAALGGEAQAEAAPHAAPSWQLAQQAGYTIQLDMLNQAGSRACASYESVVYDAELLPTPLLDLDELGEPEQPTPADVAANEPGMSSALLCIGALQLLLPGASSLCVAAEMTDGQDITLPKLCADLVARCAMQELERHAMGGQPRAWALIRATALACGRRGAYRVLRAAFPTLGHRTALLWPFSAVGLQLASTWNASSVWLDHVPLAALGILWERLPAQHKQLVDSKRAALTPALLQAARWDWSTVQAFTALLGLRPAAVLPAVYHAALQPAEGGTSPSRATVQHMLLRAGGAVDSLEHDRASVRRTCAASLNTALAKLAGHDLPSLAVLLTAYEALEPEDSSVRQVHKVVQLLSQCCAGDAELNDGGQAWSPQLRAPVSAQSSLLTESGSLNWRTVLGPADDTESGARAARLSSSRCISVRYVMQAPSAALASLVSQDNLVPVLALASMLGVRSDAVVMALAGNAVQGMLHAAVASACVQVMQAARRTAQAELTRVARSAARQSLLTTHAGLLCSADEQGPAAMLCDGRSTAPSAAASATQGWAQEDSAPDALVFGLHSAQFELGELDMPHCVAWRQLLHAVKSLPEHRAALRAALERCTEPAKVIAAAREQLDPWLSGNVHARVEQMLQAWHLQEWGAEARLQGQVVGVAQSLCVSAQVFMGWGLPSEASVQPVPCAVWTQAPGEQATPAQPLASSTLAMPVPQASQAATIRHVVHRMTQAFAPDDCDGVLAWLTGSPVPWLGACAGRTLGALQAAAAARAARAPAVPGTPAASGLWQAPSKPASIPQPSLDASGLEPGAPGGMDHESVCAWLRDLPRDATETAAVDTSFMQSVHGVVLEMVRAVALLSADAHRHAGSPVVTLADASQAGTGSAGIAQHQVNEAMPEMLRASAALLAWVTASACSQAAPGSATAVQRVLADPLQEPALAALLELADGAAQHAAVGLPPQRAAASYSAGKQAWLALAVALAGRGTSLPAVAQLCVQYVVRKGLPAGVGATQAGKGLAWLGKVPEPALQHLAALPGVQACQCSPLPSSGAFTSVASSARALLRIAQDSSGRAVPHEVRAAAFHAVHTLLDTPALQAQAGLQPGVGVQGQLAAVHVARVLERPTIEWHPGKALRMFTKPAALAQPSVVKAALESMWLAPAAWSWSDAIQVLRVSSDRASLARVPASVQALLRAAPTPTPADARVALQVVTMLLCEHAQCVADLHSAGVSKQVAVPLPVSPGVVGRAGKLAGAPGAVVLSAVLPVAEALPSECTWWVPERDTLTALAETAAQLAAACAGFPPALLERGVAQLAPLSAVGGPSTACLLWHTVGARGTSEALATAAQQALQDSCVCLAVLERAAVVGCSGLNIQPWHHLLRLALQSVASCPAATLVACSSAWWLPCVQHMPQELVQPIAEVVRAVGSLDDQLPGVVPATAQLLQERGCAVPGLEAGSDGTLALQLQAWCSTAAIA